MYYDNSGAQTGGYLLWMTTGCDTAPTTLSNVYIGRLKTGKTLGTSVWPDVNNGTGCKPTMATTISASWASLPITGSVQYGTPAGGEYVPAGLAGASYLSPGYVS
jgi:hypothetical protein